MPSSGSLKDCADLHLAHTDPTVRRAFGTYDRLGDPDTLAPLD